MKTAYNTDLMKIGKDIVKSSPDVITELYGSSVEKFNKVGSKKLMKEGRSCELKDGTSLSIKTCVFRDSYDGIPITVERKSNDGYWRNVLNDKEFGHFLYIIKNDDGHTASFYSISRRDAIDLARQFPIVEKECGGRMQRMVLIPFNHSKIKQASYVYNNDYKLLYKAA